MGDREYSIGETGYLKEPFLGYYHVEVVGFEGDRLIVRLTSGREITIDKDELDD